MVCNCQRARGLVAAAYLVAVGFLAAGAGPARATFSYGATDLALGTPDYSTSFDGSGLADSDLITSQFSGDGFTFSGGIRFPPVAAAGRMAPEGGRHRGTRETTGRDAPATRRTMRSAFIWPKMPAR